MSNNKESEHLAVIATVITKFIRSFKSELTPVGWIRLKRALISTIENDLDNTILNSSEETKVKTIDELKKYFNK